MSMNEALRAVVGKLPERLKADFEEHAADFGGSNAQMNRAGAHIISNLQSMWSDIAVAGFPSKAFGGSPSKWIGDYVNLQTQLYATLNEPGGQGTGGTIVRQLVAGDLIDDLLHLIARTVRAVFLNSGENEAYESWAKRWGSARLP